MRLSHVFFGAMMALQASSALAATITSANGSTGDNVVSKSCDTLVSTGITLKGCFNGAGSGTTFLFEGDEEMVFGAGGQARVDSTDDIFDYVRMLYDPSENLGITEMIFNVDILNTATTDLSVEFTIEFYTGSNQVESRTVDAKGENFFTVTAGPSELIKSITLRTVSEIIEDVQQVRVASAAAPTDGGGPGPGTDVPAPASLALLGAALAGLGLRRARRA